MDEIETCNVYGTPLKELDEDEVYSAKAPRVEDQIVADDKGRRRFHGAFTGGFSAGYFNTVGTKDGWAPSQFVSSRSKKVSEVPLPSVHQLPEDFMDEEDLEAHGIAPKKLQTTGNYNDLPGERKRKRIHDPGPIPGRPVLELLLQPSRETIGMKLLKKLGWRIGQGVGPRLSKKDKRVKERENKRIYGCQPHQISDDGECEGDDQSTDDESTTKISFAPDDVEVNFLGRAKNDLFGIGYKPLERTNVLGKNIRESDPVTYFDKNKKISIHGQAFGVGAFEDEDDDIYSREDMTHYDFELGPEIHKSQPSKKKVSAAEFFGLTEKMEGFQLSSKPLDKPKVFPLPSIPADFSPFHISRKKRFEVESSAQKGLGRHELSYEDRRRILSDKTSHDTEIQYGVKESPQSELSVHQSLDSELLNLMNEVDESSTNISDFKPFSKDPEKQRRYDLYVKMKAKGMKDRFHLIQPKSLTDWEKERERMSFQRASELFAPLNSSMALRFTHGKTDDSTIAFKNEFSQSESEKSDELDPQIKAAKSKMFGKLTQFSVAWSPDNLVCKRFNVPNPHVRSETSSTKKFSLQNMSIFDILTDKDAKKPLESELSPVQVESTNSAIQDKEIEVEEEYDLKVSTSCPPSQDLFKAIFQDSSSEESEDEAQTTEKIATDPPLVQQPNLPKIPFTTRFDPPRSNIPSSTSHPPRSNTPHPTSHQSVSKSPERSHVATSGIFCNIDFSILNEFRNRSFKTGETNATPLKNEPPIPDPPIGGSTSEEEEEGVYGPSLIKPNSSRTPNVSSKQVSDKSSSEDEIWVEKTSSDVSKKHKHKSKKSKKKKHKKEKKHKSKNR